MEELLMGLDIGTTGTKCVVLDTVGKIVKTAYVGYPTYSERPGRAEQDAVGWWDAAVGAIRECTREKAVADAVRAVALSSQGGSLVPVDERGEPLRRAIVWMDKRAQAEAVELTAGTSEDYFYLTTGWELEDGLNACQILWMKHNEPELYKKTSYFLSAIDYINLKLTGRPCIDPSSAGITQLFSLRTMGWDEKILSLTGVEPRRLADIVPSGRVIGTLSARAAFELGLQKGIRVVSGGHDQYCVALGAGAVNEGDTLLATGTCWVVVRISTAPHFDTRTRLSQSVHTVGGMWGSLGSQEYGGSSLEWFRRNGTSQGTKNGGDEPESLRAIDAAAAGREPGANGLLFYPCFNGVMLPDHEPLTRASFLGLNLSHDRYDMARAVMEGVVFQTRRIMELFGPVQQGGAKIRMLGGATKSRLWSQITADILGVPVTAPNVADIACIGAAALAGCGTGHFSDARDGYRRLRQPETNYWPDAENAKRYQEIYGRYVKCAALLKQCYSGCV